MLERLRAEKPKNRAEGGKMEDTVLVSDEELLREIKRDPVLLADIQYRILTRKLHNQIMEKVSEAIESGTVQVNSIEDIETCLQIELLLAQ